MGTLGAPWGFISATWSSIWVPLGSMLVSRGHFGVWPWIPGPLSKQRLKKATQNARRNGYIFKGMSSLRRKWQAAFGLRLCSRTMAPTPCFQPLSLHRVPLFWSMVFVVFCAQPGTSKSEVGGRGGTQFVGACGDVVENGKATRSKWGKSKQDTQSRPPQAVSGYGEGGCVGGVWAIPPPKSL